MLEQWMSAELLPSPKLLGSEHSNEPSGRIMIVISSGSRSHPKHKCPTFRRPRNCSAYPDRHRDYEGTKDGLKDVASVMGLSQTDTSLASATGFVRSR